MIDNVLVYYRSPRMCLAENQRFASVARRSHHIIAKRFFQLHFYSVQFDYRYIGQKRVREF